MQTKTKKTYESVSGKKRVLQLWYEPDECRVQYAVWDAKHCKMHEDDPLMYGEFDVEVYVDDTWLPYEETFDAFIARNWEWINKVCEKIGLNTTKEN